MKRSRHSRSDIISNLPNNVIESILGCLPIRDAVRTSILSTKWKDKWVTLPHLVFNKNTFKGASVNPQAAVMKNEIEVIKVASQVLLQHNGLVLKFVLSIGHLRSCLAIDHWLDYLSRNGIEELTLEIQTAESHIMPSSFFSCQHLRHLRLSNCIVRPPSTFIGYKKLTRIKFERVLCSATSLENIIANSPLLKGLMLIEMLYIHPLNISSPNLECLWFGGKIESLCTINAPCLVILSVSINCLSGLSNHGERNISSSLFNLIGCLPATIEMLGLNSYTSQTSQSPYSRDEQVLTLMKANLGLSMELKKLEIFKMTSMSSTKPEMEFIKFILDSSPVLKKVTIEADKAHPCYNSNTTLKQLVGFSRASSAAKIIYLDNE